MILFFIPSILLNPFACKDNHLCGKVEFSEKYVIFGFQKSKQIQLKVMARLNKSTAQLLATLAAILIAAAFLLFGYLMGWEYLLGFFPIITIVVIIVGVVLWILGFSKEQREHPEE